MDSVKSVADTSGSGSGRGGGGGASTPDDGDVIATAGSPPSVVESTRTSSTAGETNTSPTVSAAIAAAIVGKKSPPPEFTAEDDIRLPDPPNVAASVHPTAVEDTLGAHAQRQSPTPSSPPPAAASPAIESAAQDEREEQPPQLDLIHQAAILSSVFVDDDNDNAGAANAAPADGDAPCPHLVFPSTSDAQAVTEPFDIQLLGPAPFETQQQDIVLSEHVAEIPPATEEQGAVVDGGGGGGHQLLLTPGGTLVLSVDSSIVLVDHDQEVTLQEPLQHVQGDPTESLSMPIVSTESNGKTILWSSTAAPGDWPPKAGIKDSN